MPQVEERAAIATPGADFKEGFVEADGFHIRFKEAGQGDPLVSFHGAGGLRISRAHEILAQNHRVIVFEAPGFGQSPANERSASMAELAATMAQAVVNLGIDRFSLMGNSFGGRLALWLAAQFPERLDALVLIAPAAIRAEGAPPRPGGVEGSANLMYAHPERQPAIPPLDPAVDAKQQAFVRRLAAPARDEALLSRFTEITMPVLALFGTADRLIPTDVARIYREKLPNCNVVMVYDAAHLIDADRPEAVASVVGDFLERHEGFLVNRKSALINP